MKHVQLLLTMLALTILPALAGGDKWLTDLDEAKKIAAKEGKAILIDFTGSDWCPPCMKLQKEVLGRDEFMKAAGKHFVLVEIDFPRKTPQSEEAKKTNKALAKKYGITGFPTVLLTDAKGKEFGRTGYRDGGVSAYLKHLNQLRDRKDMD